MTSKKPLTDAIFNAINASHGVKGSHEVRHALWVLLADASKVDMNNQLSNPLNITRTEMQKSYIGVTNGDIWAGSGQFVDFKSGRISSNVYNKTNITDDGNGSITTGKIDWPVDQKKIAESFESLYVEQLLRDKLTPLIKELENDLQAFKKGCEERKTQTEKDLLNSIATPIDYDELNLAIKTGVWPDHLLRYKEFYPYAKSHVQAAEERSKANVEKYLKPGGMHDLSKMVEQLVKNYTHAYRGSIKIRITKGAPDVQWYNKLKKHTINALVVNTDGVAICAHDKPGSPALKIPAQCFELVTKDLVSLTVRSRTNPTLSWYKIHDAYEVEPFLYGRKTLSDWPNLTEVYRVKLGVDKGRDILKSDCAIIAAEYAK